MIQAKFYRRDNFLCKFSIKGHAGYADAGSDIVCACVTSAVELTANAITEILKLNASVETQENEIRLFLPENDKTAQQFLEALYFHLKLLSEDYGENLSVIDMEV